MKRAGALGVLAGGLASGGAALILLAVPPAAAAPAVSGLASNYWWQAEQGPSTVPAPPAVPAGGLWVSSDPTGPQSVSAVRFVLPAGATAPVLSLSISSAQPATGIAGDVVACPTTSSWAPGPGPGQWSARPVADCQAGQVTGALSPDGHTLSFSLASIATGGVVDVVLGPAPPGPVGSPTFDVTFQPVTTANVSSSVAGPAPTAPAPGGASPSGSAPAGPGPAQGASGPVPSASGPPPAAAAVMNPPVPATPFRPVQPVTLAPPPGTGASPSLAPANPAAASSSGGGAGGGGTLALAGGSAPSAGPRLLTGRSWRDRILLGLALVDIAGYLMWQRRPKPATAPGTGPGTGIGIGTALAPVRVGRPPPLR